MVVDGSQVMGCRAEKAAGLAAYEQHALVQAAACETLQGMALTCSLCLHMIVMI
jgi:hypothetical protein